MITLGSGQNSVQLYSKELQSFQRDCLYLEQDKFKVSYVTPNNEAKLYYEKKNIAETLDLFWKILTKFFAAYACEEKRMTIFLTEDCHSLKKIVVNCSCDLKNVFGGHPSDYNFEDLARCDNKTGDIWYFCSLDGKSTQENFRLKEKELLAKFNNYNFWSYQFLKIKG
jgi:hypothetical protein